jgi:hypothetical protein
MSVILLILLLLLAWPLLKLILWLLGSAVVFSLSFIIFTIVCSMLLAIVAGVNLFKDRR